MKQTLRKFDTTFNSKAAIETLRKVPNGGFFILLVLFVCPIICLAQHKKKNVEDYVNPFMGTTTLWDSSDLGYKPTHRAWGGETFPGASLPNAMVQVTPVTKWKSGSGYQYEDTVIYAFAHTSKGHWNLCYAPFIAVSGSVSPESYFSQFSHDKESASPGYYQVYLKKYGINAEVTSTLRCAYHRYTFQKRAQKKLLADLASSNEHVRGWEIEKSGANVFTGFQRTGPTFYFYAVTNCLIQNISRIDSNGKTVSIVNFVNDKKSGDILEVKFGFSYVSIANAKKNLEAEMLTKTFDQVRNDATKTWHQLLSKVQVSGGTEDQKETFYSTFYRSFLWPILLSDVNGDYVNENKKVVNKGFNYYSIPSFWDTYRNKLILLGMISPEVTSDVIKSLIDRGEITGYMPTFFHGDHSSVFIAGSYLRGIRDFDIRSAYKILLNNAFVEGKGGRPYLNEYINKGWISEMNIKNPNLETVAKAAVTKTQEYAYDDYATALIAKEVGDTQNYNVLMKRTDSYKHLFDPETQMMRGRLADGRWIAPFNPEQPYYEYMYREANAWQSTFFAPHDPLGLVHLYPGKKAFQKKLDSLFTIPWKGYEAYNFTGFIGQYCQGNQPDHSVPYFYYFIGQQEKAQKILNLIMSKFYRMGTERLAYAGMDEAGEMSSWYVLNALRLYTFSPADPEYIITVPLFSRIKFDLNGKTFTIEKTGNGTKIKIIKYDNKVLNGYFISHNDLLKGKTLNIVTN